MDANRARCLLSTFSILAFASGVRAQNLLYTLTGDEVGDSLGFAVRSAGDVDGDGLPDIVVGAPGNDDFANEAGSTTVYSGANGTLIHSFLGPSAGALFGFSVDGGGDVDGDGRHDVIAGAPFDAMNGAEAGAVFVYSGLDGALLLSASGSTGDQLGRSVAGVGDLNGDGHDDVLVGAPFGTTGAGGTGYARVFSGADGLVLHDLSGLAAGDQFGAAVAGIADLNSDAVPDFMVGAPFAVFESDRVGTVTVYSGADGSVLFTLTGDEDEGWFGSAIAEAGDLDGDGVSDILVGAENAGNARGLVTALSGVTGEVIFEVDGDANGFRFGHSVDGMADVNGDGTPDIIVGADEDYTAGVAAGAISVLSGVDGSSLHYVPGVPGSYFGAVAAGLGDINGDGRAEFIGSARRGEGGRGTVHVFSESPCTSPLAYCTATPNSTGSGAQIGHEGVPSIGTATFTLTVTGGPAFQPGIFFYGAQQIETPFGDGVLCVGAADPGSPGIFRLDPPSTIGADGTVARSLDFSQPPLSGGLGTVFAGSTWNFQFWYRDPAAGGSGFNLSDGLAVLFCG